MNDLNKLNIEMVSVADVYAPYYRHIGRYINPGSKEVFCLSGPQADTFYALYALESPEEQFELFCYAYLRSLIPEKRITGKTLEELTGLSKKFGYIWNGNAHHTLPAIDLGITETDVSSDGLNFELLRDAFKKLAQHHFILCSKI